MLQSHFFLLVILFIKQSSLLLTAWALMVVSSAQASEIPAGDGQGQSMLVSAKHNVHLTPLVGYRYDHLQWSIPDNGDAIDGKLSELNWKTNTAEAGLQIHTNPEQDRFNYLGKVKYGMIFKKNSKNQDSDYDNIGEYSRAFSKVKGDILEVSMAVGYSTTLSKSLLTYYGGLEFSHFNLKDFGVNYKINRQRFSNVNLPLGQDVPNSEHNKTYQVNTYRPWIGISTYYQLSDRMSFTPLAKLYFFSFHNKANWMVQPIIVTTPIRKSFIHNGHGWGIGLDGTFAYTLNRNLAITSNIEIKKFVMLKGRDNVYMTDGSVLKNNLKSLFLFAGSITFGIKCKL